MRRSLLVSILVTAACCAPASAEDWRGWRGLEKQGRSAVDGPVHWSPTKNVRWKSPVPGKGHSSPIVYGDKVIVTTAYRAQWDEKFRWNLRLGIHVLMGFAVLFGLGAMVRACRQEPPPRWREFVGVLLFAVVLGLWVHFAATARLRLQVKEPTTEDRIEQWLFAGQAATLCLVLVASCLPRGRRARLVLAGLAVAVTATIIFARPVPGYFGLFSHPDYSRPLQRTVALPMLLGVALLAAAFLRRSPRADTEDRTGRLGVGRLLLSLCALVLGLSALGLPMGLAAYYRWRGVAQTIPYRWTLIPVGTSALAAVAACVVARALIELAGLTPRRRWLPRWLGIGFLLAGGLDFAQQTLPAGKRMFTRALYCFDRDTGRLEWIEDSLSSPQRSLNRRNSPATPTPVVAEGLVHAWFGSGARTCNRLSGEHVFSSSLPYEGVHGLASSPVAAGGMVIFYAAQPRAPYVYASRTAPRHENWYGWKVKLRPWPGAEGQHRTPSIAKIDGKAVLLIWGWDGPQKEDFLRAFDVRTGKELWKHPVPTNGEQVASVVVEGDAAYLVNTRRAVALSLSRASRGEKPELWATDLKRKGPYTSSPVLVGGMLFMVSATGTATCLDATTGRRLWQKRLRGKQFYASIVAAGSRVYFCNASGLTTVVAAEPAFRKLAENDLGEPIIATPAPVDGRLYIRTARHLWCIQE